MAPTVSTLLPVYNGERYLEEALASILQQTFEDFELVVVDDGSTDGTSEILAACRDPRLRVARNRTNQGLVAALNRGLSLCRGQYVARMDADDVSLPDRFALQVECLDSRPDVCLCGSWFHLWAADGGLTLVEPPADHETLRASLLFSNPFSHPSVMYRREWLRRAGLWYRQDYVYSEDYDLWARMADLPGGGLAVLPRSLLWYRWHGGNSGSRHARMQYAAAVNVRKRLLGLLGLRPNKAQAAFHERLVRGEASGEAGFLPLVADWIVRLLLANSRSGRYCAKALSVVLGSVRRHAALRATG